MRCPACNADEAKVVRTVRADSAGAAQERCCRACGHRHVTVVVRPPVPQGTSVYQVARMMKEGELGPTESPQGATPLD